MKSKTFCFNIAVFRKNMVLFWPLWLGYLLLLLGLIPGRLWMKLNAFVSYNMSYLTPVERSNTLMYYLQSVCDVSFLSVIVLIMAAGTVMALFGYLFSSRSTNMMHAFPVTRAELFCTTIATALVFMVIPEMLAFIATVLICLAYGITCVEYIALFFAILAVASLLFLAIGMFAAMLTGQLVAVPVIMLLLNYIYVFPRRIAGDVMCILAYGMTGYNSGTDGKFLLFSPLLYFSKMLRFRLQYEYEGTIERVTGIRVDGISAIGWYGIAAVVLFVITYILYQKRPLEKAGDLVAFAGLAPVFRWGSSFLVGYTATVYLAYLFEQAGIVIPKALFGILMVMVGLAAFFLSEMLLQKSFHIFHRKLLKEGILIIFCLSLSFGIIYAAGRYAEAFVPKQSQIRSAKINLSYELTVEEAFAEQVLRMQEECIAHAKDWFEETKKSYNYASIHFSYELTNGHRVERNYRIPFTEEGLKLIAKFCRLEKEPELFLKGYFKGNFDRPNNAKGSLDVNYSDYFSFGDKEAKLLLEAIQKDAYDGTIQRYNLYAENGTWESGREQQYCCYLNFSFKNEDPRILYDSYFGEYTEAETYISVSFGSDCRHLLDALVELGYISAESDLMLVTEYEQQHLYEK